MSSIGAIKGDTQSLDYSSYDGDPSLYIHGVTGLGIHAQIHRVGCNGLTFYSALLKE